MLSLPDRELFVADEGLGTPVLMLPGLGGTTSMFQLQAEALADTHRVLRLDPAGAGRSPLTGPVSIGSWADDAMAVLDHLAIDRVTVVAHSLGTLVAAELSLRHPSRVRSVVALGPVRSQPDPVKAATRKRAATVRARGMEAVVDGVVAMAVSDHVRREKPLVSALISESLLGQPVEGYAASCEALAAATEPRWSEIAVPVWLIGSDDDRLSTPETVDAIEAELHDVHRDTLVGAGHWMSVEEPDKITAIIRRALAD